MPIDSMYGRRSRRRSDGHGFLSGIKCALGEREMLETLLESTGVSGGVARLSCDLLERYRSFGGVCDAPIDELNSEFGIPENTAVLLKLLPQISRMYFESKINLGDIADCSRMGLKFQTKFIGRINEALALWLGDSDGKTLYFGIVSEGSLNSTDVPLRKIVDLSLRYRAKYAYIGHNHPSGSALPSRSDLKTTRIINGTLKNIGVELVDHYIITDDDFVSLYQSKVAGKVIFTDDE